MLPVKKLQLALARVPVTRFEGLLCRAVHSGTLYGFLNRKPYPPRPVPTRNLIGPDRGDCHRSPKCCLRMFEVRRGIDQWGRRTPGAIRQSNDSRSGRGSWPSYEVWRRAVPYAF
jgi:hypothetical protein